MIMKNICIAALLCLGVTTTKAQDTPTGEIKLNVFNTIVLGSVEVGYEHFIDADQSIGVELFINDRFSYTGEVGSRKFNTNSVALSYNFYLSSDNNGSGWELSPLLKYRFGDHKEIKDYTINGATVPTEVTTDMDSFIIGLGVGYKWVFKNKFTISPYANIGRNFSKEVDDRFSAVEFNAGFSVGYRF